LSQHTINLEVNGRRYESQVHARLLLVDFIRDVLNLTGTHVGCEHGVCGTCTILMDGELVRSCLMLAVQADGHKLTTVEGLSTDGQKNKMSPVQEAFRECHGLQCGFCTPGMLVTTTALLEKNSNPTEQEIRESLSGNICRCTGYVQIVDSVKLAAKKIQMG
jgi:aerobic-type carbon monoxide dehydrogenase small subunit (CoxS/CutS family)